MMQNTIELLDALTTIYKAERMAMDAMVNQAQEMQELANITADERTNIGIQWFNQKFAEHFAAAEQAIKNELLNVCENDARTAALK